MKDKTINGFFIKKIVDKEKAAPVPDVLQFVPSVGANSQRGCQA